jgi:hypothetical protein
LATYTLTCFMKMCLIIFPHPPLLPCGLLQVFSHNPQVQEALRVLWRVPALPLETLLRKLLVFAFVLGLEA